MELEDWKATDPDGVEWTHSTDFDWDDDGWSYEHHLATSSTGETRFLSWSRFEQYRQDHFTTYVEAGMPPSPGVTAWIPQDIEKLIPAKAA